MIKKKKTLFDKLDDIGVEYGVGRATTRFGMIDNFVFIEKYSAKQADKLLSLGFDTVNEGKTLDRDLDEEEASDFRKIKSKFELVFRNQYGAIFKRKNDTKKKVIPVYNKKLHNNAANAESGQV